MRTKRNQLVDGLTAYRLGEQLGKGGYGQVKVGTQIRTGIDFAVKIIPTSQNELNIWLFNNEVAVLKRLLGASKNLVQFEEEYVRPSNWYIVIELAHGGDLSSRDQRFTEVRGKAIIHDVLLGIAAMHDMFVVHRDLKPANILLKTMEDDSPAMIADFGLAAMCTELDRPCQGQWGTEGYMAPEVYWPGHKYGCEVDMWSFGITMCDLFFRTAIPIEWESEEVGEKNCVIGPFPPGLSDDAEDFIIDCLDGDPDRRITAFDALEHRWFQADPVYRQEDKKYVYRGERVKRS